MDHGLLNKSKLEEEAKEEEEDSGSELGLKMEKEEE